MVPEGPPDEILGKTQYGFIYSFTYAGGAHAGPVAGAAVAGMAGGPLGAAVGAMVGMWIDSSSGVRGILSGAVVVTCRCQEESVNGLKGGEWYINYRFDGEKKESDGGLIGWDFDTFWANGVGLKVAW